MKATDINLPKEIKFDFDRGQISFMGKRLVIFDADAIGYLRQSLVKELGVPQARRFFLQFSFKHGYSDFLQTKIGYTFDSEMDLLASGPVVHTWEGIVHARPLEIRYDRKTGDFYFTGVWTNSYEAEQFLMYKGNNKEPVCWSLMGYASGWCTAFFGKPLLAVEQKCMGMGADHCEWLIKPPDRWGPEAKPYLEALQPLFEELKR